LVELLVAIMLFSILMAMTVPIVLTLGGVFANATRNLTSQDQQILTSNELNRILEGATAPPGTSSSSSTFQAVYLVCPDAMIFYTNAPLPGEHAPNYGGWVYIYLTENENEPLPNGQASYDLNVEKLNVEKLNVEKVGLYGATKSLVYPWGLDGGSTSNWSSDCGRTQTPVTLTYQVIQPLSGNVFFSIDNVIASSQPSIFTFYSGQSSCTGKACQTKQANQVGEVSYDIQVRDLVCGDHCTASDVNSTPSVTLRSMVIMPNVLLADGEGSGIF
jgi:hypothetical protein